MAGGKYTEVFKDYERRAFRGELTAEDRYAIQKYADSASPEAGLWKRLSGIEEGGLFDKLFYNLYSGKAGAVIGIGEDQAAKEVMAAGGYMYQDISMGALDGSIKGSIETLKLQSKHYEDALSSNLGKLKGTSFYGGLLDKVHGGASAAEIKTFLNSAGTGNLSKAQRKALEYFTKGGYGEYSDFYASMPGLEKVLSAAVGKNQDLLSQASDLTAIGSQTLGSFLSILGESGLKFDANSSIVNRTIADVYAYIGKANDVGFSTDTLNQKFMGMIDVLTLNEKDPAARADKRASVLELVRDDLVKKAANLASTVDVQDPLGSETKDRALALGKEAMSAQGNEIFNVFMEMTELYKKTSSQALDAINEAEGGQDMQKQALDAQNEYYDLIENTIRSLDARKAARVAEGWPNRTFGTPVEEGLMGMPSPYSYGSAPVVTPF
jgi:hypothetical protein